MDYDILPLPPSPSEREWLVYLRTLETKINDLRTALKPFADAVYNDNGDMTIDHAGIGVDQFAKAYFVMKRTS